ncbi:MAG: penicillin acylase family protein [Deltaproteobacteria bacterium]|nr:penicillin acylase family protein [Deltaproteobacteria bacterium]
MTLHNRFLTFLILLLTLNGCFIFKGLPEPVGTDERLQTFPVKNAPLRETVTIYWDDHLIPFIEAQNDGDLALTLGVVHAHLRLAQMELFRQASSGRLAETLGPYFTDIDYGLRILGFREAALTIEKNLPESTRQWIERYVQGINYYKREQKEKPHEAYLMKFRSTPWTVTDVLTISRMFGADVNWITYFQLLPLWGTPDWPKVWSRVLTNGRMSIPSFARQEDILPAMFAAFSKSGSNSIAIGPVRSATSAAIMANDPHLGIQIPNLWLIAGYKSPSYHVVGLMLPGLPVMALGRNPDLAWGGTNMRAASSDLYDVSGIPESSMEKRTERITVRWWFDKEVTVRVTPWGPVITDTPLLKKYKGPPLALRWAGHEASDEIGALLQANRAASREDFINSWSEYGVSGQNILFADRWGDIGHVLAVKLPRREYDQPPGLFLDPRDRHAAWNGYVTAQDLPSIVNPPEGFLASSNNLPVKTEPEIGFFFMDNDRIRRIKSLIGAQETVDQQFVRSLQHDVVSPSAVELRDFILKISDGQRERSGLIEILAQWDGRLAHDSRGALVFGLLCYRMAEVYYGNLLNPAAAKTMIRSASLTEMLLEDWKGEDWQTLQNTLTEAAAAARKDMERWDVWGDMHRLQLSHILSRIPLLGRRYIFEDYPASGGSTTVMKTAHTPTSERHAAFYGSNARHISEMSGLDNNWFLLLGGQDGWLGSDHLTDQAALWRENKYIRVPLRLSSIKTNFRRRIILEPKPGEGPVASN